MYAWLITLNLVKLSEIFLLGKLFVAGGFFMNKINELCKAAAAEGTVLLKNTDGVLPFKKGTRLAVFGRMQTAY